MDDLEATPPAPQLDPDSVLKAEQSQHEHADSEEIPLTEEVHQSRPYSIHYGEVNKGNMSAEAGPVINLHDADDLLEQVKRLKGELTRVRASERRYAIAAHQLAGVETDRDRFRATVLSLAYQNKVLNDELSAARRGKLNHDERYVDARLQIQDLREALALKEMQVEDLRNARNYIPTSDRELVEGYKRMRDVFESLRSTLACALCYELYKPGDITTLECGHTMCRGCLQNWSETHIRLYNLATTPDCPECRQSGRRYVKVFLLEEIVRTVDRLERLESEEEAANQAERKARLLARRNESTPEVKTEDASEDEEIDELA